MKLEFLLLRTSRWLSAHAMFCLLTLLIALGIALGLWAARSRLVADSGNSTRSAAAQHLCAHASVRWDGATTLAQFNDLLREEDARVLYGPDEFGDFQLRFGSSMDVAQSVQRLRSQPQVRALQHHTQCE